jgi:hypothetical protein
MTDDHPLRKFQLNDGSGRSLGRTLYIEQGVELPLALNGEKWVEVAGFDEVPERASNGRLGAVLDTARQMGLAIVRSDDRPSA